jgi:hypothetical protein
MAPLASPMSAMRNCSAAAPCGANNNTATAPITANIWRDYCWTSGLPFSAEPAALTSACWCKPVILLFGHEGLEFNQTGSSDSAGRLKLRQLERSWRNTLQRAFNIDAIIADMKIT